jgi:thiol-disulfide isomerase/thioredoxin
MSMVGKPCPAISGLLFIKGESVKVPSSGKPMILEFWASWCGPCRAAFPHLSSLARQHRDAGLVVVGINIEGDTPAVRSLVTQQGDKMDYTVAIDAGQEAAVRLMQAAGVTGIPCAFVIDDKGIIKHYGHPMDPKFAKVVEQVCKEAGPAGPPPAETRSREELLSTPVKELKSILTAWKVDFADLNEKAELVDRILEKCSGGK